MKLLITGASGLLGAYLLAEARAAGDDVTAWSGRCTGARDGVPLRQVDLADRDTVTAAFQQARPDAVIHAGAISSAAQCQRDPETARRVNTDATAHLAHLAGPRLLFVSTDLVFDGERPWYREGDEPSPLSVYGRTKADAERFVLDAGGQVARVSLLFGPSLCGRPGFFDQQLAALRSAAPVTLFEDEWRTPLSYLTAARALLQLARSPSPGVLHLGGPERMSRLEMGRRLAAWLGVSGSQLVSGLRREAQGEPRPRDVSLDSSLWRQRFPDLARPRFEEALAEMRAGQVT